LRLLTAKPTLYGRPCWLLRLARFDPRHLAKFNLPADREIVGQIGEGGAAQIEPSPTV
jgi:hypothetical protein